MTLKMEKASECAEKDYEEWIEEEKKREKKRITKNIVLISISFLLLFTAYGGLSRLQSSLHRVEGMGTISQAVLYTAMVLSCLFLPKIMTSGIGHKWTIVVSMSGYTLWMVANGYAVWGTMIPTAILVGICAAPLWTAQCSYYTKLGVRYANINHESEQDKITWFFGLFFMFFQFSGIIGSVISSTVLRPRETDNVTVPPSIEQIAKYCGANDCPGSNFSNPNLERPAASLVWTMVGIYLAIAVGAIVLVAVLVENLPPGLRDARVTRKDILKDACATIKQLQYKEQLLLIPITVYSGLEQTFMSADFTASFVTCAIGIHSVGLVTIAFAGMDTISSVVTGRLVKYTGRLPIFIVGCLIDLGIQITLQTWVFAEGDTYVLYVLAGLWGISDGIWQTQINAMYGAIFSSCSEAAFSNYRMWESLGFIIGFAYSSFLCTRVKLLILTSFLSIGMVGYGLTEYSVHRSENFDIAVKSRADAAETIAMQQTEKGNENTFI